MPSPQTSTASRPGRGTTTETRLQSLPQRTYRFRVLGMGLAALPLVAVMRELDSPPLAWAWVVLTCVAWPHIAYFWALRSRDRFRAELRNFVIDSLFAGSWVPLMHFNLLPSVVLLSVVTADKVNSGIRGLWLRAMPGMLIALLVVGALTGFAVALPTSTTVLLASLPILVIHTLAVSLANYGLVRRVQRQNQQLDALSRVDALTGLDSRGHWEEQAQALLHRHQRTGQPATLLLFDIDHFKSINDRYGHAVGDDVLRAIADLLRRLLQADSHAGRLGGDELAAVVPADADEVATVAERLREAVAALAFPRNPGLQCSVSIGLAEPPGGALGLREWIEAADQALYRAKSAGRNRIGQSPAADPLTAGKRRP